MAAPGFSQRFGTAGPESWRPDAGDDGVVARTVARSSSISTLWMVLDAVTVVAVSILASLLERAPATISGSTLHEAILGSRSTGMLIAMLCGFTIALILISRQLMLYSPLRLDNILDEQRRSVQACFTAGLLLIGALYLAKNEPLPRELALSTVGTVTILLSVRRLLFRLLSYRGFQRGRGLRNVLIVGTGPEAHALRNHIDNIHQLGYTFKGFIQLPGEDFSLPVSSGELVGTLETMFDSARKQFVDELFFAAPCNRSLLQSILEESRANGVDLRVIPYLYEGLARNRPIEYIGQFPTIPLHRGHVPEIQLVLKRGLDILISFFSLAILSPLMVAISIAIRLDSEGPLFYASERLGKKGQVFRCIKFRTMVRDADKRRAEVLHMNERDGVLFKIARDPRITRIGRILRKYSFDELPQFYNVLLGDMSMVGPRPPLASEVQEYKLSYLRRLDVKPGVTGLWQVQARQDPSFHSYISLDISYVENWNLWLDLKILARTVVVVFQGTGS